MARAGIPLIDNDRLFLGPSGLSGEPPAADAICIGGVGDLWEAEIDAGRAFAGVPPSMPRLLLSHNPDAAEVLPPDLRVDLMLSGHTHGGQVAFPVIGAPLAPTAYGKKYLGGLCRGPTCPVVVSRGVGITVLPVRLSVPPELVLITLRRA
jgi:predicted MPP superfamily phosphohydrolase